MSVIRTPFELGRDMSIDRMRHVTMDQLAPHEAARANVAAASEVLAAFGKNLTSATVRDMATYFTDLAHEVARIADDMDGCSSPTRIELLGQTDCERCGKQLQWAEAVPVHRSCAGTVARAAK